MGREVYLQRQLGFLLPGSPPFGATQKCLCETRFHFKASECLWPGVTFPSNQPGKNHVHASASFSSARSYNYCPLKIGVQPHSTGIHAQLSPRDRELQAARESARTFSKPSPYTVSLPCVPTRQRQCSVLGSRLHSRAICSDHECVLQERKLGNPLGPQAGYMYRPRRTLQVTLPQRSRSD